MSFLVYDLVLLGIFILFIAWFLYKGRKNLKREGVLLLYRTEWGMRLIDRIGKKYKKTLDFLGYISVGLGYLLMIGVLYMTYTIVQIYLFRPDVVSAIKVPPIMPLIPYIDKVVTFLPPFYFTYWIIIIAIIAIFHEFAHGIYMRRHGINIKSTGFGFFPFFFPIFPAAFVEQDEKSMGKAKNFEQRKVLSAGTFANTLTAIVFLGILALFFILAFAPAGVVFDDYSYSIVNISDITMVNGKIINNPTVESLSDLVENSTFNEIIANSKKFVGIKGFPDQSGTIALYDDSPAINASLNGAITEINNEPIYSINDLSSELDKYSAGEEIVIKTKTNEGENITTVILSGENPTEPGKRWLGIVFFKRDSGGLMGKIFLALSSFKDPNTYYEPIIGDIGWFIYHLLWWLILISISVALVNMLPMGIFDGGMFFYLTVLKITKSEKIAKACFKWITRLFLLILLAIMVFWAIALIL